MPTTRLVLTATVLLWTAAVAIPKSTPAKPKPEAPTEDSSNSDEREDEQQEEAQSDDESLEDELDALEAEVGADEDDQDDPRDADDEADSGVGQKAAAAVQSMNPEISLVADLTGAWHSGDAGLRGGHDPSATGFNLQGLELSAGASVDPFFRLDTAILFSLFGVEIEEAYGSTLSLPWQLKAKFGQFKTNFGRLNPTHLHTWAFATQPLAHGKFFGGESLRGLGVELSQLVLPVPGTFRWYLAVQNVAGESTGRSFAPTAGSISSFADLTVSARLEEYVDFGPNTGFMTGLNYALGRNKTGRGNVSEIYGLDLYLKWKNSTEGGRSSVGWQTEFMIRRRQVPGDVLEDYGGYTRVSWQPGRYWGTGLRYEYVSGIGPDADHAAPSLFGGTTSGVVDPLDPEWTGGRQRGAAQVSYYPSHFSRLRLQYSLDHAPHRTGSGADPLVHMVFLQAELVAGAHGSHDY